MINRCSFFMLFLIPSDSATIDYSIVNCIDFFPSQFLLSLVPKCDANQVALRMKDGV